MGNRARTTSNGIGTDLVVDPLGLGNLVGEYNAVTGGQEASYDHGLGLVRSASSELAPGYFTFDRSGNTSEVMTEAGLVYSAFRFAPFGEVVSSSGVAEQEYCFGGEFGARNDGAGGYHMRARSYRADLGRFVSKDPIGLLGGDTHLYRYVENAPTQYVDRSGLAKEPVLVVSDVIGTSADMLAADALGELLKEDYSGAPGIMEKLLKLKSLGQAAVAYRNDLGSAKTASDVVHATGMVGLKWLLELNPLTNKLPYVGELVDAWDGLTYEAAYWFFTTVRPPTPPTSASGVGGSATSGSLDPNEKLGPAGWGPMRAVKPNSLLSYRVNFENLEDEPKQPPRAPAQIVMITDQLDPHLDGSTFSLTSIGFGDVQIPIAPDTQYFETVVPMTFNGTSFEVRVEAGIRRATNEVFANFYSIDPATSLPPAVDVGFLPPNDETERGQGFFSFVIRPLADTPHRTVIRNIAEITFDFGETIATNQVDPHDPSMGTDPEKEAYVTIWRAPRALQTNKVPTPR